MYFSVSSHRGRINEPGVEDAGEREGNIERVRQWRCCAFRSPPFSERNPPGEGRIVTRGVRHAQILLDVEVMMLVINMALRAPVSPRAHGIAHARAFVLAFDGALNVVLTSDY